MELWFSEPRSAGSFPERKVVRTEPTRVAGGGGVDGEKSRCGHDLGCVSLGGRMLLLSFKKAGPTGELFWEV